MRTYPDEISAADHAAVAATCAALSRGGVVVYPTETFYGLGVDATDATALQRLVTLKVRQVGKPISVLVSNRAMLNGLVTTLPATALRLMDAFWPGPLTLVLPACADLSEVLTGGTGTIGVRISSHPLAAALVGALDRPLTAPSANPAAAKPPTTIAEAHTYFGASVDYYFDAGRLPGEPPSTVVAVGDQPRILRDGAIARAALDEALR